MDRETLLDLIPAYALGALDSEERAEFEAWLSTDAEGRHLLAEYQAVADALVFMTPARPAPAHLTADLRKRLAAETSPHKPVVLPRPTRRLSFLRPLAAVAVFVLVAAVVLFWSATRVDAPNGDGAQLFAQLAEHEQAVRVALVPDEGLDALQGELVSDGERAVIEVWELPALNSDQTYELWLVDANGATSGGLFETAPSGEPTYIVVPLDKPLDEYDRIGVSIEPEGGSPEAGPTGPRVFGVSL